MILEYVAIEWVNPSFSESICSILSCSCFEICVRSQIRSHIYQGVDAVRTLPPEYNTWKEVSRMPHQEAGAYGSNAGGKAQQVDYIFSSHGYHV